MRRSLFSVFAFLSLQTVFFEPCYGTEDEDSLDKFVQQIQKTSLALELWYSHYTTRPAKLPFGLLRDDQMKRSIHLSGATLQICDMVSAADGGAIHTDVISLDNMAAPIVFKNNISFVNGGGIAANKCVITNNKVPICFDHNAASKGGGILSLDGCKFENNSGPIYFLSNMGNAIQTVNIEIKNCSSILFFSNNTTGDPGCIRVVDNGVVNLSADNGHITFYMNQKVDTPQRSALYMTHQAQAYLGAKKYYSLQFYDPIQYSTAAGSTLTFNPEQDQLGTVLFSSQGIVRNENTLRDRFSYFERPCTLAHGTIRVTDGAGLGCYQFTQNKNTILCLGDDATITTNRIQGVINNPTQGCFLTITKIALDLLSITKPQAIPPKFWIRPSELHGVYSEDNYPTVTLSGDLIFLDENGNAPYDSMDLSKPLLEVPLLRLWDNATKRIDISNFSPEGANSQGHYGYQGTWKFYWVDQVIKTNTSSEFTTNSSRSILYGDWTPTGYIPNPKYKTPLVANAIWESVYTLMPGMQLGTMFDDHSPSHLDGQLTGMVHVQNNRKDTPGFHMRTKSYWTGGKYAGLQSQKLSLHFGQSFSHIKEKQTKNKLASKNYGVTFKVNSSIKDDLVYLSASLGYAYGTHKVQHFYPDPNNNLSTGEFFSTTLSVFAHLLKPTHFSLFNKHVSSFVEAHLFQSFLSSFKEQGAHPRSFKTNRPFYDLTVPVGIMLSSPEQALGCPNWSLRVAYHPTVYRESPSILTTFLASNGSWISSGTKVSRHALNIQLNSEVEFLSRLLLRCSYEGSFSMTTVCNYATCKGILKF